MPTGVNRKKSSHEDRPDAVALAGGYADIATTARRTAAVEVTRLIRIAAIFAEASLLSLS